VKIRIKNTGYNPRLDRAHPNNVDPSLDVLVTREARLPKLEVTGFWMRSNADGYIEVLARHRGKWLSVFGGNNPAPVPRDREQQIDHMIHSGGIQNLIDYGSLHGGNTVTPARVSGKPDRRSGTDQRADKRRRSDKVAARLKGQRR